MKASFALKITRNCDWTYSNQTGCFNVGFGLVIFIKNSPIPFAAYRFLASFLKTCLYKARALSWCLFSFALSLVGVCSVWSHTFPRASKEYASLAVDGCFKIRSNFFCPGPHSCLAKWRLPIKDQASGWSCLTS